MSGNWFWEALGWLALALNVWGNLALTSKGVRGWIIRLVCNACWIPYAIHTGAWALLANHVLFAGINVYGWYKWKHIHVWEYKEKKLTVEEVNRILAEVDGLDPPTRIGIKNNLLQKGVMGDR